MPVYTATIRTNAATIGGLCFHCVAPGQHRVEVVTDGRSSGDRDICHPCMERLADQLRRAHATVVLNGHQAEVSA